MAGPIEFIGEVSRDTMPNTEYGGTHGLIQPEFVDGNEAHSELTEAEKAAISVRVGVQGTPVGWMRSGEDYTDGVIQDPVTGRIVDPADLTDVTGKAGKDHGLSDLKPGK